MIVPPMAEAVTARLEAERVGNAYRELVARCARDDYDWSISAHLDGVCVEVLARDTRQRISVTAASVPVAISLALDELAEADLR